jgi:hypothetical protein
MCVAMHGVRLEGTSGRRNNLARIVGCGMKNAFKFYHPMAVVVRGQSSLSCFLERPVSDPFAPFCLEDSFMKGLVYYDHNDCTFVTCLARVDI